MLNYYFSYVMKLMEHGLAMGKRGVLADTDLLAKFREKLKAGVEKKRARFERLTGRKTIKTVKKRGKIDLVEEWKGVSASSPKQLIAWLYDELKLPVQYVVDQKTREKKKTSGKEAIEKLGEKYGKKYPALRLLLWLRKSEKMLSTYAEVVTDSGGRIHTVYYVTGTESGRFSSKKTEEDEGLNMQNLPPWFRRVLIPDPGKVFLEGDLASAETRIVAYLAGEEAMIEVFNDPNRSIHKMNVEKIFGIQENKVEKDSRPTQPYGMAKRCTHGWDYLLGDKHAARITGKTKEEMARHRIAYFRAYSNLLKWQSYVKDVSLSSKILITPFGRRRLFLGRPPKRDESGELFANEELARKMVAWVPQSTCTEYLKRGCLRMMPRLPEGAEFLVDSHDGFLAQCWPKDLETLKVLAVECICQQLPIKDIFGTTRNLTIPLELKTGDRWGGGMK